MKTYQQVKIITLDQFNESNRVLNDDISKEAFINRTIEEMMDEDKKISRIEVNLHPTEIIAVIYYSITFK